MSHKDLRVYIQALDEAGLLHRITEPVDKDTELMPLVRLQYRGLAEEQRKAFLFTNVVGGRGERYATPVLVAATGASRRAVACAMGCDVAQLRDTWLQRVNRRLQPVMVSATAAPCQELVIQGSDLTREGGGLLGFPVPISTPGFDPSPYITSGHWVTKDPDTGIRNVGNYRTMIKGPAKCGLQLVPSQHIATHFFKCKERGVPMEAAICLGNPPSVALVAPAKFSYGTDEFEVAGGIDGRPLELVKCRTVDIEVPAHCEVVVEGRVRTDVWELEAPFGEFSGYVGERRYHPFFEVTCITHRKNPIWQTFISQFPPSESSKVRQVGNEANFYDVLKNHCNIGGLLDVAFPEVMGAQHMIVLQMKKRMPSDPWMAMHAAAAIDATYGKVIITVDEDINPHQMDSVLWALSTRCQPHLDIKIQTGRASQLDPSAAPPGAPPDQLWYPKPSGVSGMMIDATRKWPYPAVSLPRKPYMERALAKWQQFGLPALNLQAPWFGYQLGHWDDEWTHDAELAARGQLTELFAKLTASQKPCDLVP